MPVSVEKIRGKFRLVESNGLLARNRYGHPVDGGGHNTEKRAQSQARKINAAKAKGQKRHGL